MPILVFAGLVDYVSNEGTPAIDRALSLANDIAANGAYMMLRRYTARFYLVFRSTACLAFSKVSYFESSRPVSRTR
jgi:hypothetical protein